MENTSAEELMTMHQMMRFVVVNELVCDVLWAFTRSDLKIPDMNPKEFQACASVMAALDHDVLSNLTVRTPEQRISDLTAQLKKHDQQTVQVLVDMVDSRLKRVSSQTPPKTESHHERQSPKVVYVYPAEDEDMFWGDGEESKNT